MDALDLDAQSAGPNARLVNMHPRPSGTRVPDALVADAYVADAHVADARGVDTRRPDLRGLTMNTSGQKLTYAVTTLGCQMNVHDSERMSGLLEAAGYVRADAASAAADEVDVLVINTCAVRENAATRLYGNLGRLVAIKRTRPGMQIAVGGCLAQQDRERIVAKAPWVDVVFGTHNIDVLVPLLERARHNEMAQVEIAESLQTFPSTLPTRRESVYAGWVSISVGCNNTCTFCIVPHLRGRERDRRPGEILAEVEALAAAGAIEVTLLGQNVNSYGVEFGDRGAFASLLRAVGTVDGIERVRFTSPHPAAFADDVIEAMASTPTVMPQLHMPLQSGSDAILRSMRRSYRAEKFLGIVDRVRAAIPDAAITSDLIVGFPGETEDDFSRTLEVVEQARFSSAFTFIYSQRPGTPAATMPNQVPSDVVHERYVRLTDLTDRIAGEENRAVVGRRVDVLIGEAEGRKDAERHRLTGRAADNRLVHVRLSDALAADQRPRPGDMVSIEVTDAAPYHLMADAAAGTMPATVRRTRAGDAWQARSGGGSLQNGGDTHSHGGDGCGTDAAVTPGPVALGMPAVVARA